MKKILVNSKLLVKWLRISSESCLDGNFSKNAQLLRKKAKLFCFAVKWERVELKIRIYGYLKNDMELDGKPPPPQVLSEAGKVCDFQEQQILEKMSKCQNDGFLNILSVHLR